MTTKSPLADMVLTRITDEQITPKPWWHFMVKNIAFYILFLLCLGIGMLFFAYTLLHINTLSYPLLQPITLRILPPWSVFLPIVWVFFIFIFLIVANKGFHSTRQGYKIPLSWLLGANIILTAVGGFALYELRIADKIERRVQIIQQHEQRLWDRPHPNHLRGFITAVEPPIILLENPRGVVSVDTTTVKNTPKINYKKGMRVRVIGEQRPDTGVFNAYYINPWTPRDRRPIRQ